jgi:hypothetical protein
MANNKAVIESFFKEADWKYEFDNEDWFSLDFKSENCFLKVNIFFDENAVSIVSRLPFTADEKLTEMAELLHRINCSLVNGCFTLDYEDAEISFQTGITFVNLKLTKELFENLIQTNIVTADMNAKMIMALLSSNATPQKIYEDAQALETTPKE